MTDDDDTAEVRKLAVAKGLEMREIDFFDGEFENRATQWWHPGQFGTIAWWLSAPLT